MKGDMPQDPKALIRESYRIDGITTEECRSIFLDWALSLPVDHDMPDALNTLIAFYAPDAPDHPMTAVLRDGTQQTAKPRRRGGWKSRPRA